jgi:hypothetical protein
MPKEGDPHMRIALLQEGKSEAKLGHIMLRERAGHPLLCMGLFSIFCAGSCAEYSD